MINAQQQKDLERFVSSEILACQSTLVDEALKREFFSLDEVENLYRPFEGKEFSDTPCFSCNQMVACLDTQTGECERCFEDNQEPQEIYEWWLITGWFAEKLKQTGEPILDNEYGIWWGRCCTGQAIFMDGVILKLYDETMQYEG